MTVAVVQDTSTLLTSAESREFVHSVVTETVTTTSEHSTVITQQMLGNVLVERQVGEVVLAGAQGPAGAPGAPGISEEDMVYTKRIDFTDDTQLYRGEAQVGTQESQPLWRIRKITLATDGDVAETWAGGTADFNKQWTLRATYNYS